MYADLWLGFTELEIERYLKAALQERGDGRVFREQEAPHFETVLGWGEVGGIGVRIRPLPKLGLL